MTLARSTDLGLSVSVVVCSYTERRWESVVRALESVRSQTVAPEEVILVIDHNEALAARARDELTGLRVLESDGPRGLAGARNTGVGAASGTIVAFLDDDATARPDWIANLLAPYRNEHVIAVGGAVMPAWEAVPPAWFPSEFLWVVGCTYRGHRVESGAVRNLIGANMSFRRRAFDVAGGFVTSIGRVGTRPSGCEETEFCIRLTARDPDAVIWYEPSAIVDHTVPADRTTWRYFMSRCYFEGSSKRQVTTVVGARSSLGSEQVYVRKALSRGVRLALREGLAGESQGWARALAMTSGVAVAGLGYLSAPSTRASRMPSVKSAVPT